MNWSSISTPPKRVAGFAAGRSAQQLAEGGADSLPVAGLAVAEPAETLHQIKGRAVDLDRTLAAHETASERFMPTMAGWTARIN
jgi:hypothetical protein